MFGISWIRVFFIVLAAYIGANVFFISFINPIGYDDAFNLQVAKSLSQDFIYQSTYFPRRIYDQRITTNGPIQYITALNLRLAGDRLGLSISLLLISCLLFLSTIKYSWKTFLAIVVLIISYPALNSLMVSFFGEVGALGFLLLGVYFSRSRLLANKLPGSRLTYLYLYEIAFYGFAISTKLILIIIIPFILFGLYYTNRRINLISIIDSIKCLLLVYFGSVFIFILLFYFSSFHSQIMLNISGYDSKDFFITEPGLWTFIKSHFWQQSMAAPINYLKFNSFSKSWMLLLLAVSAVLLIRNSLGWIPLVLFTIGILGFANMNERRLFLVIMPILLIAVNLICLPIKNGEFKLREYLSNRYILDVVAVSVWIFVLVAGIQAGFHSSLIITKFANVKNILFQSKPINNSFFIRNNMLKISTALKDTKLPVVASGWWQYPQVQIATGHSFYDRMEPSVEALLKGKQVLFIFDPANKLWPESSVEMCAKVLLNEPDAVVCIFDRKNPLNFRWGVDISK